MFTGQAKNGKSCLVVSAQQLSHSGNNNLSGMDNNGQGKTWQTYHEELTAANTKLKRQRRQLAALLRSI